MKNVHKIFFLWLCLLFPLPFLLAKEDFSQKKQKKLFEVIQKVKSSFVSLGGGSGVIISSDGYILSNDHVTRGVAKHLVILPGGKVYRADLIGSDTVGDIALLKIQKGKNLPFVSLGDSQKIQPGQPIFALGNPWGFAGSLGHPTVTFGVISTIHRYQGGYGDCFQIDASLNPGNSGGPTFDLKGNLLGINGQIRTRFAKRVFSGIGLAIPINQIKNFLPLLKKGGEVFHGSLPKGLKFSSKVHPSGGVEVIQKQPGHISGGFQKKDVLLTIQGIKAVSPNRILGIVSTFPSGSKLLCKVLRQGTEHMLTLVIKKIPTYSECQAKGIPFRFSSHPYVGLDFGEVKNGGVEIIGVIENSPADLAHIVARDILLSFDGNPSEDRWNLRSLISGTAFGHTITLKIKREKDLKKFQITIGNTNDYPIEKYKSRIQPFTAPTNSKGGDEGDEGEELSPESLGFSLGEDTDEGIQIDKIKKGSLAKKHGFQKGDLIFKFNGEELEDAYDLENKLMFVNKKNKLKFQILRRKKNKKGKESHQILTIEFFFKK